MDPEKEKIINFVGQKFFKEGFYKISMDELARELQVSKKTIYKYFPSKEKLVEEIVDDLISCIKYEITSIINAKENVIWKFVSVLKMYNRHLIRATDKWQHDIQIHTPHIWQKIDKFRTETIYYGLNILLEQGKKEKLIEDFPNELIIAAFVSNIRAVMNTEFILKNKFSMQQAFGYTYEILMNGILTKLGLEKYHKMKEKTEIEASSKI